MRPPRRAPLSGNTEALTKSQAAELLGYSPKRFRDLLSSEPTFPVPVRVFVGSAERFLRSEILSWLKARPRVTEVA